MEISWFGHACFQLRGKNAILITDPFSPQSGEPLRLGKANPSIVTISHTHPGHAQAIGMSGTPYVVRGPGEYEINDVLITGVASYHDDKNGKEQGHNTIYVIHMDDLVICHLGALGHTLKEEQLEEVADADVLLVPIGSNTTINATQAAEVISQVEPHLVIPMYSMTTAESGAREAADPLDKFCREMGVQVNTQPQSKMNVTRSNLPLEMQVVLLSPR
jgi:L-ascorbate metabolism protein UlaG (beta-lactamase superfamily)